jgi:type IX secretion system PorP/SprF family membrane protein
MKKSGTILSFAMLHCLFSVTHAQDPVFSHFYANSLLLNPSLAGVEETSKFYMGYSSQWSGPNSVAPYVTYHATYDKYIEKLEGGIGIRVLNDRQGDGVFNAYNLDLIYAYQFRATHRLFLSGGLQAGFGQRSFDPTSLVFRDMYDPVSGEISANMTENFSRYSEFYPDFSAGITAFSGNFYGGIALHHLFSPLVNDKNDPAGILSLKYTAHFGALIPVVERRTGKEIMQLSPNLVVIQQQSIQQINYGLDVIFQGFLAGIWTRHDLLFNYGNIMFTVGYNEGSMRFRYSYDIKLSSPTIRLPNLGAHELSLIILTEKPGKRKKRGTIKIPKI